MWEIRNLKNVNKQHTTKGFGCQMSLGNTGVNKVKQASLTVSGPLLCVHCESPRKIGSILQTFRIPDPLFYLRQAPGRTGVLQDTFYEKCSKQWGTIKDLSVADGLSLNFILENSLVF